VIGLVEYARFHLVRECVDGDWYHLYAHRPGRPESYLLMDALARRAHLSRMFGIPFRIVPESDFDLYRVPVRY